MNDLDRLADNTQREYLQETEMDKQKEFARECIIELMQSHSLFEKIGDKDNADKTFDLIKRWYADIDTDPYETIEKWITAELTKRQNFSNSVGEFNANGGIIFMPSNKELERLEATIDANTNALLEASIAVTNLSKENQRLNALASTMKLHLRNFCSSFEARFDLNPDQFVTEECYEYMDSAKFLEKHYRRVSNYVVAVTIYLQNKKV